jgi:hypothetical protein
VVAESGARNVFRNLINLALPVIVCPEAARALGMSRSMLKIASSVLLVDTMQSPVKNAGRCRTPWLFGICKYSRLQGPCP